MATTTTTTTAVLSSPATYTDLGPMGRVVAGTVEVAVSTLLEYLSGFVGGYVLGTVTGLPQLVLRTGWHWARLHDQSRTWAGQWGGVSAAFGGFRVVTKVVRGGTEDEWNTVLSSMAAGAFLARADGWQAMVKGAVTYGGLMYVLSGNMFAKKEAFKYEDRPIEF
jgi:hypothetical protein